MKRLIVGMLLIAGIGIGIWLAVREDPYAEVQPTGGVPDHLDVTGEPIFVFGDLYLDGRSAWARCLFDEDLEGPPLNSETDSVEVSVREAPFTAGPWLEGLDEAGRARREAAETRVVESRLWFRVPDVPPERVALLLVAGRIGETADPGTTMEWYGSIPEELPGDMQDAPGRYVYRRKTRSTGLRKPTDAWYVGFLERRKGCWVLREELWANGSEDTTPVRFDVGQYVISAEGSGSLVENRTLYRGQGFPALIQGMAISRTKSFWEGWIKTVGQLALTWEPSESVRSWAAML